MACEQCCWLDVPPDRSGRRVVRKGYGYECQAPVPEVKLPASITIRHGFQWPPRRSHMTRGEGKGCPSFERKAPLKPATI